MADTYTFAGGSGGGGGGSPGGSNGQIQFNNSSAFGGVANSSGADSNGYIFPARATFTIPSTAQVGNDITANWYICERAGKFVKGWAIAKSGPTGAALIFNIDKSSNNGSTWTSIWATHSAYQLTIAASAVAGNTTSFDTTTFAAGDILRIDVSQVGSTVAGANITVTLQLAEQNT